MSLLEKAQSAKDLKKLSIKELSALCQEIRDKILTVVKNNGGHLSSNLGVVELTVALHYVFDLPNDKLIFDVGHQCYTHKLLTKRDKDFESIRCGGGLSGFPDREESEFDPFSVGHAGCSISAGLGYALARDKIKDDYFVINFVGDGSIVNGLNLEAITSTTKKPSKFIVILNDNGMSIAHNGNGFYHFIARRKMTKTYVSSKNFLKKIFGESFITRGLTGFRNFIKRVFNKSSFFEQFGFKYASIKNGNDIEEVVKVLQNVKDGAKDKAVFLHVKTTKGKGYVEAEENAEIYHGVGKDLSSGDAGFSAALGDKINSLIEKDKKIVAITAGMSQGTGLYLVEQNNPDNFYDVGIAEEYAITLAGGMASGGLKPIVAIYSTFMQRAFDQVIEDVCLQNLPVIFCLDRSGLVGEDGKTHQGVFDLGYLSMIPNMTVLCPTTTEELDLSLDYALKLCSPVAIRYPKNSNLKLTSPRLEEKLWNTVIEGQDITVLAVGPAMTALALEFANKCDKSVRVVCARTVKPLDESVLDYIKNSGIITLEENVLSGGFGSAVNNYYLSKGQNVKIVNLGVKDEFISHGSKASQRAENLLTVENLIEISKTF